MTAHLRLTVVGSTTRADLVVPDSEPVGVLIPDLLDLLEEPSRGGEEYMLMTTLGRRLDPMQTLVDQDVRQGTLMHLCRTDDAPIEPFAERSGDIVGMTAAAASDAWSRHSAWAVAVVAAVILCLVGGHLVEGLGSARVPVAICAAAATIAGSVTTRWVHRRLGVFLAAVGVSVLVPMGCALLAHAHPTVTALWMTAAAGFLGLLAGFALRKAPLALGGIAAMITTVGVLILLSSGLSSTSVLPVAALVATIGLGSLPGLAIWVSGLGALDDRVLQGGHVVSHEVELAVAQAHRLMAWTATALAALLAVCLVDVAHRHQDPWTAAFVASTGLVAALRARNFPLVLARAALLAAAAAPVVWWLLVGEDVSLSVRLGVIAVAVVVLGVCVSVPPSELRGARLRRRGDVLELLAVLTTVPALLGLLGILNDLGSVFR